MKYIQLGELVEIVGGGTPDRRKPEFWNGKIPWATVKDLISNQIDTTKECISSHGIKNSASRIVPSGNIIIATRMALGKAAINNIDVAINQDLKALFLKDENKFDKIFLLRFLLSKSHFFKKCGKGATVKGITLDVLKKVTVPVYPIETQQRIAAILDKADALRQKRKQALQLADQFLRSVFLNMFGDPVKNPKNWPKGSLGDFIEFMTSGSRGWAKHYSESGDKFLRIQNVGYNELKLDDLAYVIAPDTAEAKRTRIKGGDILLSITADLGRTAVAAASVEQAYINQHLALLRVNNIIPEFISAYFATPGGQRCIQKANKGGVKAGLNFGDIRKLPIYLPPRDLQAKYKSIEFQIRSSRDRLVELNLVNDQLFYSLTQQAFLGNL